MLSCEYLELSCNNEENRRTLIRCGAGTPPQVKISMTASDDVQEFFSGTPLTGLTFTIHCGIPGLIRHATGYLEAAGARFDPQAAMHLLIDAPLTFARRHLEQVGCARLRTIVVTANTCPEYIEDIWELQPTIVIVGNDVQQDVIQAVRRAANGERYCMAPGPPRLSARDRAVLRYLAEGWEFATIADHLSLAEKTIRNRVSHIYRALGLQNRSELTLYYHDLLRFHGRGADTRHTGGTDVL